MSGVTSGILVTTARCQLTDRTGWAIITGKEGSIPYDGIVNTDLVDPAPGPVPPVTYVYPGAVAGETSGARSRARKAY